MPPEWNFVVVRNQKQGERFVLGSNPISVGRDANNTIVLPHASVSRRHATITLTLHGPEIVDHDSRNGTSVNGIPRRRAVLQAGDELCVGIFNLRVFAERPHGPSSAVLADWLSENDAIGGATAVLGSSLPDGQAERHLAALYRICLWLTEETDHLSLIKRTLGLLRDVFQAIEGAYYGPDRKLQHHVSEDAKKPVVKFAPYLAEKVQAMLEATAISGESVRKLQERLGAFNYLAVPLRSVQMDSEEIPFLVFTRPVEWQDFTPADRVLLQAVSQIWSRGVRRTQEISTLRRQAAQLSTRGLLGESSVMQRLRTQARQLADGDINVLIIGENGSGKEPVAELIQAAGRRSQQSFIKTNCASIAPGLIESELFGHEKGAFTDAKTSRDGRFQQADGGTLFLDEVGEMSLTAQAKVLRVLESGEIEKVGGRRVIKVDVRVIAATNRDLDAMVSAGTFREDLLYRLDVGRIQVPPLRDHVEDIAQIAASFAASFCAERGRPPIPFDAEAIVALQQHAWPGNVRELRHVVVRCCIHAETSTISAALIQEQLKRRAGGR